VTQDESPFRAVSVQSGLSSFSLQGFTESIEAACHRSLQQLQACPNQNGSNGTLPKQCQNKAKTLP
jgi:hypothetical protein